MTAIVIEFTPMDKLPHRIRLLRKKAGMTIEELAQAIGMKPPHLSMAERGLRPVSLERMREIASVLQCSTADLLSDQDNPDRLPPPIADIVERLERMDAESIAKVRDIAAIFAPEPELPPLGRAANGD
ncbi:MAG: helix-turn-helix transcriptional regulator [Sphingobium sp.]|uniref:helix-turn-helix domain-containing protein n=1 Tax=Sphingobium sp. TaxID=1912891 RepID=UPI003BB02D58